MPCAHVAAFRAALTRELLANRLSRFLHVHLLLATTAGLLPLFTPTDAATAAPWWVLQAVLYCLSLSALLLGLNSAHGEADEYPMLFSQPTSRGAWLAGKTAGLSALVVPSAVLLVAPAALMGGFTAGLGAMAAAAAGLSVAMAAAGLALGFWIRDHVRGLLAALAVWFVLLFGSDILLLAIAGAPWVQARPGLWVVVLMLNPLDALRVTALFGIQGAAPPGLDSTGLIRWWLAHSGAWLALLLAGWTAGGLLTGLAGARRSVDA
jgi:hypothetical protein